MNNTAHASLAPLSGLALSALALVLLGIGCAAPTSLPDGSRGITRSAQRHAADQEQLMDDDSDQEQSVLAVTEDPSDEAADDDVEPTMAPEAPIGDPSTSEGFSDDSVRCGDGVLDEDELCDTAIPSGEVGACPTECVAFDICHSPAIALRTCWTQCVLGEKLPC